MFRTKIARRAGFSLGELVLVMLIMVIVIGFLLIAIQRLQPVREGVFSTQTANNLKQITLACHSFNDVYKRLPAACDKYPRNTVVAPVQIHLAPFFEQANFYELFLKAEGTGEVTQAVIPTYLHPGDYSMVNAGAGVQNMAANLRVFSDKGFTTAYDANMPVLAAIEPGIAAMPRSFPDGTSNTMAFTTRLAECGDGGSRFAATPDSRFAAFFGQNAARVTAASDNVTATFQLAPDRFDCRPTPLMGHSFGNTGITVSLFDGSRRQISPKISPRTWNLVVQPNDGMKLGADWDE